MELSMNLTGNPSSASHVSFYKVRFLVIISYFSEDHRLLRLYDYK